MMVTSLINPAKVLTINAEMTVKKGMHPRVQTRHEFRSWFCSVSSSMCLLTVIMHACVDAFGQLETNEPKKIEIHQRYSTRFIISH